MQIDHSGLRDRRRGIDIDEVVLSLVQQQKVARVGHHCSHARFVEPANDLGSVDQRDAVKDSGIDVDRSDSCIDVFERGRPRPTGAHAKDQDIFGHAPAQRDGDLNGKVAEGVMLIDSANQVVVHDERFPPRIVFEDQRMRDLVVFFEQYPGAPFRRA